jgi:tripartite-type tricarboxylate transporter receptor subunit TctC
MSQQSKTLREVVMSLRKLALLTGALAVALPGASVLADEAADFYKGKNIEMAIAASAKGSYNQHVRLIQRYLTKHIAGNPNVIVKFYAGAGGIRGANHLYNVGSKDGLTVGNLLKTIAINEAIKRKGVKYKSAEFGWIISTGPVDSVLALMKDHTKVRSVDDARKMEAVLGSTGKGSATFIEPTIMNQLLGTKFKVITGYKGLGPVHLAMEKGEVAGRFASVESLLCCKKHWLEGKQLVFLAQSGLRRNKAFPDVPRMIDLVKSDKDKKFLEFFGAGSTLGRIYVTPPGVPKAQLAALREGFWKAANDPAYVEEMKKGGLEWDPMKGEEAKKLALLTLDASQETIARARKVMGTGKKKKK